MRFLPSLCALVLLLASGTAVRAQTGLMDIGKDLLRQQVDQRLGSTASAAATPTTGGSLDTAEIGAGLKETLGVAIGRATDRLGRTDGFNADPKLHIPLPGKLQTLRSGLAMAGQSALLDDLETRMNRAAEESTPEAKRIFLKSVQAMSLDDARAILTGPQDAATQYFQRTMSPELKTAMRPVIDRTLAQSGASQAYQGVTAAAGALPMLGGALSTAPTLLGDHVVERALSGLFSALGEEEAAIRTNPAKRSTELLRKLFSSN